MTMKRSTYRAILGGVAFLVLVLLVVGAIGATSTYRSLVHYEYPFPGEVVGLCVIWLFVGAGGMAVIGAFIEDLDAERQQLHEAYRQQYLDDLADKYTEEEAA